IGLAVSDQEIALSVAALTPLGWVEVCRQVEPVPPDRLDEGLERLIGPWLGRGKTTRWPVILAIPALRVFYTTRSLPAAKAGGSPQAMLQEVLQTSNASSD